VRAGSHAGKTAEGSLTPYRAARIRGSGAGRVPAAIPDAENRIIEPKVLAALAAQLADAKKGTDIRVYDVSEHIRVVDYFVLASGLSRPHVKAIHDEIHIRLKAMGEKHSPAEGAELGWWVLLDYSDVVVHVLQPEAREYYALDQLYGECPEIDWKKIVVPVLAERAASQAG